ncbi:MAG: hypothetical protein KDC93_15940 [Cyclobacteriaceae bacterium]|jgi:hypothetical protein|nr:hypothetical protein [Cyclobacteriaceae bacterium]
MTRIVYYATVSEALRQLKEKGFDADFNLGNNCIVCDGGSFSPKDFEILEVYRYEGQTDPADEATVYGIESSTGIKGVLVTGYGAAADLSGEILTKLSILR